VSHLLLTTTKSKIYKLFIFRGDVIINKGEKSEFLLLLYSGEIGIYLHTMEELDKIGMEGKCVTKITGETIVGDRGLLNKETRTATCIANTDVEALIMSHQNYVNVAESFHKMQLKKNLDFTRSLEIMQNVDSERLINLTHL
jgi:CRP-like cAMP-binding protein